MTKKIHQYIASKLQERIDSNALRILQAQNELVDFCSNDYLGLARSEDIAQQVAANVHLLAPKINGGTGARTIAGTSQFLLDLEAQIAAFHKDESALFYNSGYTANLGLFSSLPYRGDTIIYDELIHASIRDGMNMSRANSYSFKHNDLDQLVKKLTLAKGKIYVAVESVYSMDGDFAPLADIARICKDFDAALIVDEAHSNGIFGNEGSGLVCELGLEKEVFARVMTFGKAIGAHGAAVLGPHKLKQFLINFSRPFIYTTAPAPHQVLGVKYAYDILSQSDDKRNKIRYLCKLFKQELSINSKVVVIPSESPIQCVILPGNDRVKRICAAIQKDGYDVRPIVAPTVPIGLERIRICIHSFNSEEEVVGLVKSLVRHINQFDS